MDPDFDFLCAHLFTGGNLYVKYICIFFLFFWIINYSCKRFAINFLIFLLIDFDQFPSFDYEDFDNTHVPVAPVVNDNKDSSVLCSCSSVSTKRGRDESLTDNESSIRSDESPLKQQKSDEEMKDKRLKFITDLIGSLNQCENEPFEQLLQEGYADNVVLKIAHTNDIYQGRNSLLLLWLATHEVYPDGMYKVLEKRYVNMTVPRGKSRLSPVACPKVEFVYKFSGTKIVPAGVASLIRNFANKHQDYATYSPEKLNDKLLQFISTRELTFETESTQNIIGESTLTFVPDTTIVKEVTFNTLAFDGPR